MNKELLRALQQYVVNQVQSLRQWIKPAPEDTLPVKVFKMIYKSLAILILLALSPVLCLALTIVFLVAL
ncbi:hypothetical protein [Nafulsella turpanensis]|uniref:hypothetical protein n=1 Tax=Nafulsella turpanensis TaxID=1265690 RepID=UPI0003492614|nr:hypothetical protein [Nafulsella turpanensis]